MIILRTLFVTVLIPCFFWMITPLSKASVPTVLVSSALTHEFDTTLENKKDPVLFTNSTSNNSAESLNHWDQLYADTNEAQLIPDPHEKRNKIIFKKNVKILKYTLRPMAHEYARLPHNLRRLVHNFTNNIRKPWSAINSGLQKDYEGSRYAMLSFMVNTFFGLGGALNVSRSLGIPEFQTGMTDTLQHYNFSIGYYVVFPFLPPSSSRALLGNSTFIIFDPVSYYVGIPIYILLSAISIVANYSLQYDSIESTENYSLDFYTTIKSAISQTEQNNEPRSYDLSQKKYTFRERLRFLVRGE